MQFVRGGKHSFHSESVKVTHNWSSSTEKKVKAKKKNENKKITVKH